MPIGIKAKVDGKNRIDARFDSIGRGLRNFKEPLSQANSYMRDEIDKNIVKGGGVVTNKWKALNPSYQNQKARKYGGAGPLQATGKMRSSFKSKLSRTRVVISNSADYFKYHQSSQPRQKLPRRVMLDITRRQQSEIFRFFTKYLNKITNG